MKTIVLAVMLAFACAAHGQSGVDITMSKDGVSTVTNNSTKIVALVTGNMVFDLGGDKPTLRPWAHEFLFKTPGFAIGDSFTSEPVPVGPAGNAIPVPTMTVEFVQFMDGSTWGDPGSSSAQYALEERTKSLAFLPHVATVGTEAEFTAVSRESDPSRERSRLGALIVDVGITAAFSQEKDRWAAAQSRTALWKF